MTVHRHITVREAAALRGVTPQAIDNRIVRGQLRVVAWNGHNRLVDRDEVLTLKSRSTGGPPLYDWEALRDRIDWSLTDTDIARQLGCSASTVCMYRHRWGIPPNPPGRRPKQDWEAIKNKIDWSLTDAEIARQLGCSGTTVCRYRQRSGIPSNPRGTRHKQDWEAIKDEIDWSLPVAEIAKQLGCSVPVVYRARLRLGLSGSRGRRHPGRGDGDEEPRPALHGSRGGALRQVPTVELRAELERRRHRIRRLEAEREELLAKLAAVETRLRGLGGLSRFSGSPPRPSPGRTRRSSL